MEAEVGACGDEVALGQERLRSPLTQPPTQTLGGTSLFVFGVSAVEEELMKETPSRLRVHTSSFYSA